MGKAEKKKKIERKKQEVGMCGLGRVLLLKLKLCRTDGR